MKLTFDEAYEIGKEKSSYCKQITHGTNGYPTFHGRTEFAFFGFEKWEEAESLAEEIEGKLQFIHYRDGWQLCESKGTAYEPFKNSSEDFGDNYAEWGDPENEFEFIKSTISYDFDVKLPEIVDLENGDPDYKTTIENIRKFFEPIFESGELTTEGHYHNPFPDKGDRFKRYIPSDKDKIESLLDNFEKCFDEYLSKPKGSEVITCGGEFYEILQKESMCFCFDTHNEYVAVVINDEDFTEEETED